MADHGANLIAFTFKNVLILLLYFATITKYTNNSNV
jgi:hypothetical protein